MSVDTERRPQALFHVGDDASALVVGDGSTFNEESDSRLYVAYGASLYYPFKAEQMSGEEGDGPYIGFQLENGDLLTFHPEEGPDGLWCFNGHVLVKKFPLDLFDVESIGDGKLYQVRLKPPGESALDASN